MRRYASMRNRNEFSRAARFGRAAHTSALSVFTYMRKDRAAEPPRVGIIVGKQTGGAVTRNRLRRRCKAILDAAANLPPSCSIVIRCKPPSAALRFDALSRQLRGALERAL